MFTIYVYFESLNDGFLFGWTAPLDSKMVSVLDLWILMRGICEANFKPTMADMNISYACFNLEVKQPICW